LQILQRHGYMNAGTPWRIAGSCFDGATRLFGALCDTDRRVAARPPRSPRRSRPSVVRQLPEALTPDEWLADASREFSFLFEPSRGGGAPPSGGGGPTVSNIPELRDPTPEQLGRHADDILAGRV